MGTPDYIRTAQNAYNAKFDLIQVKLPKGTKERIKAIIGDGGSMAAFCVDAILETIDGQEAYGEIAKTDKERRREETKQRERMRDLETEAERGEGPDFMSGL